MSLAEPPQDNQKPLTRFQRITDFLKRYGIETNGIDPVPEEARTDTRLFQMFFVWFSANMNVLGMGTGAAGPAFFSLGVKQSLIIITIVDIIYFGSIIPSALNVFSMQGFLILNCIIGGQTLASVSGHLDDTLGIVIIGVISLIITFCGYNIIHKYESIAWIPNVITFIIMFGIGGKHLLNAPAPAPVTAANVITFATTTASSVISWCSMTPDYGVYHDAKASGKRIFITVHYIGAIFAASAPYTPTWSTGFDNGNSIGGLIQAVLSPLGGFGKFLTVLLALTIPSACAPTMYTFGSSAMTVAPWFARVPRYVYVIVSEAILIPVAIIGAKHFYDTFVDVLSIIGYWSAISATIILTEHLLFRRNAYTSSAYNLAAFNRPSLLPPGIAAVLAFCCAVGIVVPCMSQVWYTGPIALKGTGDIGILVGSAVAGVVYVGARAVERGVFGR
ncbi:cytosine-purine permease [Irpex lacteus]|nr:cytosine-purine permease [Irpex lacteus]